MQRQALFALGQYGFEQVDGTIDHLFAVFAHQTRLVAVDVAGVLRGGRKAAGFARAQDRAIECAEFLDPAQDAGEADAVILGDAADPAFFVFGGDQVQAAGDGIGDGLKVGIGLPGIKGTRKRGLLKNPARVIGREGIKDAAELARAFDDAAQVGAGDFLARTKAQDGAFDAHVDQVILKPGLILDIDLRLTARDFVERGLGDVEVAAFDQFRHLAEEECQDQRADMRAIDIGIGHDDDLVVAQFLDVELIPPDAGAQCGDQGTDFLAGEHAIKPGALDVKDFPLERQDGLIGARAALFGGATGRVTLDQEEFGFGGIAFLTIGQLAGERGHVERRLAAGQFARLAGGFAGEGRLNDLADDDAGVLGVFFEPFGQLFVDEVFHRGADL